MSKSTENKITDLSSTLKEIMGDYKKQADTLHEALITVKNNFKNISENLEINKITLDPIYDKHKEYIFNQFKSWLNKVVETISKRLKDYDKENSKEKLTTVLFTYLDMDKRKYFYSPTECDLFFRILENLDGNKLKCLQDLRNTFTTVVEQRNASANKESNARLTLSLTVAASSIFSHNKSTTTTSSSEKTQQINGLPKPITKP